METSTIAQIDLSVEPILYPTLHIDPQRFLDAFNLDVSEFVDKKGGSSKRGDILYLSYSHAYRLLRTHFPELEVSYYTNPQTGSPIFAEIGNRGYFCKTFVHDGKARSAPVYYSVLNASNANVFPDDVEFDRESKKPKPGKYVGNPMLFNKAVLRGQVKAIALVTGIGLKLWTGQDLTEEMVDEKLSKIQAVEALARTYKNLSGKEYNLPDLDYTLSTAEINAYGKELQMLIKQFKEGSTAPALPPAIPNVTSTEVDQVDDDDDEVVGEIVEEEENTPPPAKTTAAKKTTTKKTTTK